MGIMANKLFNLSDFMYIILTLPEDCFSIVNTEDEYDFSSFIYESDNTHIFGTCKKQ